MTGFSCGAEKKSVSGPGATCCPGRKEGLSNL